MTDTPHAAGAYVSSYCSKCRRAEDHVVIARDGEAITKVKCTICGGAHKFRDPATTTKTRTPKKKEDAGKLAELMWESCLATANGRERTYDMACKYRVGDVVLHSTFGKGVVRRTYLHKCDVLFRDKERLMATANERFSAGH